MAHLVLAKQNSFLLLQSHSLYPVAVLVQLLVEFERHIPVHVLACRQFVPNDISNRTFVKAEDICLGNIEKMCRGIILKYENPVRVTRNIKLAIDDDTFGEVRCLLAYVSGERDRRQGAPATCVKAIVDAPAAIVNMFTSYLELDDSDVQDIQSTRLDLKSCMGPAFAPETLLRETVHEPVVSSAYKGIFERLQTKSGAIVDVIKRKDIVQDCQTESFQSYAVLFLHAASCDPQVRSIKTVLHRCGHKSIMKNAFTQDVKAGKEVPVLVELKASLDEVHNAEYAKDLQLAGCNVLCGLV